MAAPPRWTTPAAVSVRRSTVEDQVNQRSLTGCGAGQTVTTRAVHSQNERMRFGNFMAPFHPVGQNPTLALERDLDLIVAMDRLGFAEA